MLRWLKTNKVVACEADDYELTVTSILALF